jgi:transposase-like protein
MKEISLTLEERKRRHFSESFKRKKVQEIESGQTKIADLCRQYDTVRGTIYQWLNKYGNMKSKKERLVIETESDTQQIIALKKENAHLKMIIGEKQIQIDFKDKMIEIAEDHYGVDIKKKFETTPSDIIKNIKKNTHTP